ncbi:BID domain-containing T4SS effector [Bartonella phoceensis]|uniref:BID domain-containing T4SS effector n=1 Tax=Bartonella phoceensis TaxID=270249 RepID=UPI001ABBDF51|nr:BID domain-containing T4SS effector [Bartonella phoceensis]
MKKNQPSPSPHFSVKELIKYYEATAAQSSVGESSRTTGVDNHKSPLPTPKKEEKNISPLKESTTAANKEEHTYASIVIKNPQRERATEEKSPEKTIYTIIAPPRRAPAPSEETITRLIPHDPWVKSYEKEIAFWSAETFGKKDILQEKAKEIRHTPSLGEKLSWQLAGHHDQFGKLAGINVCGIKNKTRKKAEKSLIILCDVLNCYGEAVKVARESLHLHPQLELRRYEEILGSNKLSQILQDSYCIRGESGFLSKEEVIEITKQNSAVKRSQEQIENLCTTVFGKADTLKKQIADILGDPSMAVDITQQLAEEPRSFYKLAGLKVCGFKNHARKHAEETIPQLVAAVNNLAETIQQVQEGILPTHQKAQESRKPFFVFSQNLHKQRGFSKDSPSPECSSTEVPETSKHKHEKVQNVRPRKAPESKTLAFAS